MTSQLVVTVALMGALLGGCKSEAQKDEPKDERPDDRSSASPATEAPGVREEVVSYCDWRATEAEVGVVELPVAISTQRSSTLRAKLSMKPGLVLLNHSPMPVEQLPKQMQAIRELKGQIAPDALKILASGFWELAIAPDTSPDELKQVLKALVAAKENHGALVFFAKDDAPAPKPRDPNLFGKLAQATKGADPAQHARLVFREIGSTLAACSAFDKILGQTTNDECLVSAEAVAKAAGECPKETDAFLTAVYAATVGTVVPEHRPVVVPITIDPNAKGVAGSDETWQALASKLTADDFKAFWIAE